MHNLLTEDITTFYVVLDDVLGEDWREKTGRPPVLSKAEMVTILIWCTLVLCFKTLKSIYNFIRRYHRSEFPKLPDYSAFVRYCQKVAPVLQHLLENSFATASQLRFVDSTMIPVCKLVRANSHKVAKAVAAFGKNHQGWHYGFKLHAALNQHGQFCALVFTPANEHDAQKLPQLAKGRTKVMVGDTSYNAQVMREQLWQDQGVFVLAYPHPKQKRKLMALWQQLLLQARPKIEAAFDYLKEHLYLVSSFPRSIGGYIVHYLRVLLAYQFHSALS